MQIIELRGSHQATFGVTKAVCLGQAACMLARFGMVSHCYQRRPIKDWPYNLFAMMHGRSMGDIQHAINKFIKAEKINSYELLPTAAELRKQPVKHHFE